MKKAVIFICAILLVILGMALRPLCAKVAHSLYNRINPPVQVVEPQDPIYAIITPEQQQAIEGAIKITFTGDLILLRDMVERAYNKDDDSFDFDGMFEYVKEYYADDDLSIGVFEGPTAAVDSGYSTSSFDDGIPIYLNFPVSFATAVKRAGIDFVTTANNHLLDQGIDGYLRTLDVLDSIGLDHSGSYRNLADHDKPKILDVKGLKIGVLTYTYGSNYYKEDFFFEEGNRHITSCVVPKKANTSRSAKSL